MSADETIGCSCSNSVWYMPPRCPCRVYLSVCPSVHPSIHWSGLGPKQASQIPGPGMGLPGPGLGLPELGLGHLGPRFGLLGPKLGPWRGNGWTYRCMNRWTIRWADPLDTQKLANAGAEYHDASKISSIETKHDLFFEQEPYEGHHRNSCWEVQEWWKNWISLIHFDTKCL